MRRMLAHPLIASYGAKWERPQRGRAWFAMTQDGCPLTTSSSARGSGGVKGTDHLIHFSFHEEELWDAQEAEFRMHTLFKIMLYCARYGRRVREQVLAFGIYPDIDRNSETCRCNNVSVATVIPEEGLLLYPVAVRAPIGMGTPAARTMSS